MRASKPRSLTIGWAISWYLPRFKLLLGQDGNMAEPFSMWGGTSACQKNYRKIFCIGNYDVTSIEIWRHYLYTIWRSKLPYFETKLHHYEYLSVKHLKFKWAVTGATQVNCVTRANDTIFMVIPQAHHTNYTDGIKPFEACVAEISVCFHSDWHYCCSVTLLTLQ